MPWGVAAAAVGTVVAGSMQADAAGQASDAQSQASANSIAEQRRQFDLTRQDQQPFIQNGVAGNNRLAYLLGIGGSGSNGQNAPITANNLGNTSGAWTANQQLYNSSPEYKKAWDSFMAAHNAQYGIGPDTNRGSDPARLASELASYGFSLDDYNKTAGANTANDSSYGSLLKKFDQNDLNNDVVYNSGLQFGLDQGTGAINQRALQGGSYDSGATLKALTKYANDYGSTKANEAYNRYNTTNDSIYNKLAGISGAGQTATNQVQAAGTNMANNVSGSINDAGNARSAGIIGGANAWGNVGSGLNNIYNNYNSNQNLQKLLNGSPTIYGANGGGSNFQPYYQDTNGMG